MENSSGVGLCIVLTIIFVILKLLHILTWSWLWVLSPLWLVPVVGLVIMFAASSGDK